MNRESLREVCIFFLLLAFGIVGRLAEPAWNFTPLAAVTAMGAYSFRRWLPAILLPIALLTISDFALLPHDSLWVQASVHVMAIVPLALGRAARGAHGWRAVAFWGLCGFVPATAFFLVTNFAVWAAKSLYAGTAAGLLDCYLRAIPFYRTMLAGDMCYVSLMVACLAAAHLLDQRTTLATAPNRNLR
jgi:hypothetical protein